MTVTEKVAYLKGLAEGLNVAEDICLFPFRLSSL